MPACPAGSVQQQVMQQYSYLFQMAQQLNLALERLEQGTGASSGGKGTEQQYRKLRSLIAGGEERLKRAVEELAAQVETEYVADGRLHVNGMAALGGADVGGWRMEDNGDGLAIRWIGG